MKKVAFTLYCRSVVASAAAWSGYGPSSYVSAMHFSLAQSGPAGRGAGVGRGLAVGERAGFGDSLGGSGAEAVSVPFGAAGGDARSVGSLPQPTSTSALTAQASAATNPDTGLRTEGL